MICTLQVFRRGIREPSFHVCCNSSVTKKVSDSSLEVSKCPIQISNQVYWNTVGGEHHGKEDGVCYEMEEVQSQLQVEHCHSFALPAALESGVHNGECVFQDGGSCCRELYCIFEREEKVDGDSMGDGALQCVV